MPGGRPSKYEPELCEEIVEFCKEGYSIGAFAGEIGVSRATINVWAAQHPEFLEALSRAKAGALRWYETRLRERAFGDGSATAAIFGVKNMGGEDWVDESKQTLAGDKNRPLEVIFRDAHGDVHPAAFQADSEDE